MDKGMFPVLIYKYIKENSDEENGLTTEDIYKLLRPYTPDIQEDSTWKTVSRNLEKLAYQFGEIRIVYKNGFEYTKDEKFIFSEIESIYYDQKFTTNDVRIISDAVIYSRHLNDKTRKELLGNTRNRRSRRTAGFVIVKNMLCNPSKNDRNTRFASAFSMERIEIPNTTLMSNMLKTLCSENALIMLYIADVFALGSVVLFEIAMYGFGFFNWASFISLLMITGLIVVLHIYMKQNPESAIVIPLNQQPIQYQVGYQTKFKIYKFICIDLLLSCKSQSYDQIIIINYLLS